MRTGRIVGLAIVAVMAAGCAGVETMTVAPLTTNPCTAVSLTTTGAGFEASVGNGMTLAGLATCPAGVVPEYQFWVKPAAAANWTIASVYLPGSFLWVPDTTGDWCVSVVTRAVGSTDSFQARSTTRCGTIGGTNTTPIGVTASVPLFGPINDSAFPARFLSTNSLGQGVRVHLPTFPVGSTITSVSFRVQDSTIGPTLLYADLSDQFDLSFSSIDVPVQTTNGSGTFQTLTVATSIVIEPLHSYYAGVFVASGFAPCKVTAIDVTYVP